MEPELLDRLHARHLEALLEIDRICRKHGIPYYIIAGTLLGAARHKGFIPWDDDLDIGLLRPDYEKLLRILPQEMDSRYFLQCNTTDPEYHLPFAKVRINGTKFVEYASQDCAIHHGIYVDLFPFDNVPASGFGRKCHALICRLLFVCALARGKFRFPAGSQKSHAAFKVLRMLLKPFRLGFILRLMDNAMRMVKNADSEYIVNIGGAYGYRRESVRRDYFRETADLPFEGHAIQSPAHWHEYLTDFYGDYMTPPPEDKRYNRHSAVEVQF